MGQYTGLQSILRDNLQDPCMDNRTTISVFVAMLELMEWDNDTITKLLNYNIGKFGDKVDEEIRLLNI